MTPPRRLRIAVAIACFNRRDATLRCLQSLLPQQSDAVDLDVYLVDDASSDGTGEAVRATFPEVHVLRGTGKLYWGGGMHLAMTEAVSRPFDFILWLNDDVVLKSSAIPTMISSYERAKAESGDPLHIIVGAMEDPVNGQITYAGLNRRDQWHPARMVPVKPTPGSLTPCDSMNGNCVLVPSEIVERIGIVTQAYIHQLGDIDYGYRARKAGGRIWIAPEATGFCPRNLPGQPWLKPGLTLLERLRILGGPRGLPFRSWSTFYFRHSRLLAPLLLVGTYWNAIVRIKEDQSENCGN